MLKPLPNQVLIVDDDDGFTFLLQKALAKRGIYNVHSVKDGAEAIGYVAGVREYNNRKAFPLPELVLTDLRMAGTDGIEFLSWMQRNPPFDKMPVVVISGHDDREEIQKARGLGALIFFRKPSTPEGLDDMVKELLTKWVEGGLVHKSDSATIGSSLLNGLNSPKKASPDFL